MTTMIASTPHLFAVQNLYRLYYKNPDHLQDCGTGAPALQSKL